MSEITVSSTNWLAISLRNDTGIVFNLNDIQQWQHLRPVTASSSSSEVTSTSTVDKQQEKTEDDDENTNELNRNLIKFTPDGQKLLINGQNKQIYIYISSYDENTKTYWQLQRIVTIKKRASAFDVTNEILLIADKSGDVYKTDLLTDTSVVLTADDCIMGHLSMLLDIAFITTDKNQQFILTTDRDEKIRLTHYPNAYNIEGFCLGHSEFVSHVKLIDQNHILSASGDGTLRLWHLPDCRELNFFETKTFLSSFKSLSYGSSPSGFENNNNEVPLDSSSINYSVWNMDLVSPNLIKSDMKNVFIAISIYAYRNHTIYLTKLSNLEKTTNEQCKLTFNSKYGTIIDYCFSTKELISNSQCNLFILFDSNILLKLNLISIFSYDKNEIDENDSVISTIINTKEFNFMNNITSNEIIFKQLFKMRGDPGDSAYYKRKNERIGQQEEKRRKKQVSKQFQEKVAINENV
ncbi:unnamed protein product [Rotaria socialis]|uniref:tRNA (guanine-N(7)-)-methyltransferase non-catalytic subunit n=1 Tax=Rotaria socialis TaxID=392032 RepID=A0A818T6I5_9BILA|nr:unnamed protein product [Rotaria socialis]CAF4512651.1 unnamed protein product [Rotaria socialis]